ncbi:MAG: hypothetical protein QOG99_1666 [Frankiales bacterium]|jgi:hypothetical protein|nr:hypothetical protein [Frankiales bacterium]
MSTASFTSLVTYLIRRIKMHTALAEQLVQATVHERQLKAEADARARRLLTVRRWQRKAAKADQQVRLARLALR